MFISFSVKIFISYKLLIFSTSTILSYMSLFDLGIAFSVVPLFFANYYFTLIANKNPFIFFVKYAVLKV